MKIYRQLLIEKLNFTADELVWHSCEMGC